ncbi:ATP-grasp domain-containing protein [Mesorhizobium sp. LHD-90]|uniref:ATP-grasp domain-containing protein n=1 Tax=Mesorhizobium sp. LHD-90 TaxID=3071414 RepID=UPI0027DEB1D7|nr:ATP-grasp domain-containing protein [Mesorhizobium sp. LHD-90]MDQ6438254.1 ATP-grasp domain-containing protein [Mesorhizobium sp. LHD-90]
MHASSPNSAGAVLIAAISGRSLAAAARRAGFSPLVADLFRDNDTVALSGRAALAAGDLGSGIDFGRLPDTLRDLAAGDRVEALVLGSGFEQRPDAIDALAEKFPLAGNRAAAIARVKEPQRLAEDCAELGIPHPEFRREKPADPENWLVKTAGGAGGGHVAGANGAAVKPGRYFQRFIEGRNLSALFIADRRAAHLVGFSRQWASPAPGAPYRYGGAVRLRRFDRREAARIAQWLSGLTARAGLTGLCSADFIRNEDGCHLVEINPRPGATLDIFDDEAAPLLKAHIEACRGKPFRVPRFDDSMASLVTYTSRPIERFPKIAWPDWTADRQPAGTRLAAGDPVCTVFARGGSAGTTRRAAEALAAGLSRHWEGGLA